MDLLGNNYDSLDVSRYVIALAPDDLPLGFMNIASDGQLEGIYGNNEWIARPASSDNNNLSSFTMVFDTVASEAQGYTNAEILSPAVDVGNDFQPDTAGVAKIGVSNTGGSLALFGHIKRLSIYDSAIQGQP